MRVNIPAEICVHMASSRVNCHREASRFGYACLLLCCSLFAKTLCSTGSTKPVGSKQRTQLWFSTPRTFRENGYVQGRSLYVSPVGQEI